MVTYCGDSNHPPTKDCTGPTPPTTALFNGEHLSLSDVCDAITRNVCKVDQFPHLEALKHQDVLYRILRSFARVVKGSLLALAFDGTISSTAEVFIGRDLPDRSATQTF